ncbi:MAG: hypothetical protein CSA45_05510 [Gammaproteobacteria bacterium]|nr:MAG: hypothetical protein CSA45_05510 [Gammaproteobacteria bacterium]
MRILHITTSYPESRDSAAGIFVKRLVAAQKNMGDTVKVITPDGTQNCLWQDNFVHRFRYAPRAVQQLAQKPGGIPAALKKKYNYLLLPSFLLAMAIAIIRFGRHADVIQCHWSICGAIACATRCFHKRPIVTTLHGSDQKISSQKGAYSQVHQYCLRKSDIVVTVNESILRKLLKSSSEFNKCFFIGNGVGDNFFTVSDDKRGKNEYLEILSIGSLITGKDYPTTFQALHFFNKKTKKWRLTIAGDGPERTKLQQQVRDLGIGDKVNFLGVCSPENIPDLMAESNLFLLTSLSEGRPSVVLEAMAAGLAVIATDIEGTKELVQDGKTGWLFPVFDSRELASLLEQISRGDLNIITAGKAGRRWMNEQGLRWRTTAEKYRNLYEKLQKRLD